MTAVIFSFCSYRSSLPEHPLKPFPVLPVGVAGAVDRECGADAGGQRPVLHATTDPYWPDPELHHPADIPLHLREQEDGHHRAGESHKCNSEQFRVFAQTFKEINSRFGK